MDKYGFTYSNGTYNFYVDGDCVKVKWREIEKIQQDWANGSQIYAGARICGGKLTSIWIRTAQGKINNPPGVDIFGNVRFGNVATMWVEIHRKLVSGKIPEVWCLQVEYVLQTFQALYQLGALDEDAFTYVMGEREEEKSC